MSSRLFSPAAAPIKVAATGSASAGQVFAAAPQGEFQIRVTNDGTTWAYITWSSSSAVAATTSDHPLPPGMASGFTVRNDAVSGTLFFSVIMASGTANIHVTTGHGV
jgi:hypothetical protein